MGKRKFHSHLFTNGFIVRARVTALPNITVCTLYKFPRGGRGKHKTVCATIGLLLHEIDRVVGFVGFIYHELLHRYLSRIVAPHLLEAIKQVVLFVVIALVKDAVFRILPSGQILVDNNRVSRYMFRLRILILDMFLLPVLVFLDMVVADD